MCQAAKAVPTLIYCNSCNSACGGEGQPGSATAPVEVKGGQAASGTGCACPWRHAAGGNVRPACVGEGRQACQESGEGNSVCSADGFMKGIGKASFCGGSHTSIGRERGLDGAQGRSIRCVCCVCTAACATPMHA
eukprot:31519-Pelagomonas_calceolata.AAC.4